MIPNSLGTAFARIKEIEGLLDRLTPEVAPTQTPTPTSPGSFQEALAAQLRPADAAALATAQPIATTRGYALPSAAELDSFGGSPLGATDSRGWEKNLPSAAMAEKILTGRTDRSVLSKVAEKVPAEYRRLVHEASRKYGVDEALILGVMQTESDFNPRCVSSAGAMGLMQLMPSNVTEYGIRDAFDPAQNIDAGVRHLRDMLQRYDGDVKLALAGYNAGPGNVAKYGGVPPFAETQNYIPKVLARAEAFRQQATTPVPASGELPILPPVAPMPTAAATAPVTPLSTDHLAKVPSDSPVVAAATAESQRSVAEAAQALAPSAELDHRPVPEHPAVSSSPQPKQVTSQPTAIPSNTAVAPDTSAPRARVQEAPQAAPTAPQPQVAPAAPQPQVAPAAPPPQAAPEAPQQAAPDVAPQAFAAPAPAAASPSPTPQVAQPELPAAAAATAPAQPTVAAKAPRVEPPVADDAAPAEVRPATESDATVRPTAQAASTPTGPQPAVQLAAPRTAQDQALRTAAEPTPRATPAEPAPARPSEVVAPAADNGDDAAAAPVTGVKVDVTDASVEPLLRRVVERLPGLGAVQQAVQQTVQNVVEPVKQLVAQVSQALDDGPAQEEVPVEVKAAPVEPRPAAELPERPTPPRSGERTEGFMTQVGATQAPQPASEADLRQDGQPEQRTGQSPTVQRAATADAAPAVFSLEQASRSQATTPTSTHAPMVMDQAAELPSEVVRRAQLLRSPGRDEFSVELRHPEAGRVSVRVVRQDEAVHVSLTCSHAGLRREVQAQLPALETALREQGLQLGSFDTATPQQQQQTSGGTAFQQAQHQSQQQAAPQRQGAYLPPMTQPDSPDEEARPGGQSSLATWA